MGWVRTYDQNYYQVEFYWAITAQNVVSNNSTIRINGSRVRSTNSAYSFYNNTGSANTHFGISANGVQTLTGANYFNTGTVSTSWREYWFTGSTRTVTHDSAGNASVVFHHAFSSGATAYYAPNFGWRNSSQGLTKIDRGAPGLSLSTSSLANTSATIRLAVTGAATDQIRYRRSSSEAWTTISRAVAAGATTLVTVSGLSPRTSYTLSFQVRRTYNQVWSAAPGIMITTDADAPSGVTVSSITPSINSVSFVAKATAGTNNAINGYAYAVNTSTTVPSAFTTYSTTTSYTKTGLVANTQYYLFIRARAVNGKVTTSSAIAFKTLPTLPVAGTVTLVTSTNTTLAIRASGQSAQAGIRNIVYKLHSNTGTLLQTSPAVTASPYNYTFTGLTAYTNYRITLTITDTLGRVATSTYVVYRTLSVITNNVLTVEGYGQTSIKVSNSATSQSGIKEYAYSKDAGSTYVTNGKLSTYEFLNLSPYTSYNLRVRVTDNDNVVSYSGIVAQRTLPLSPEITSIDVVLHKVKDLSFQINIKPNIVGSEIDYYQYHFYDSEGDTDIYNTSRSSLLEFHNLRSSREYYLEVYAVDIFGQSSKAAYSNVKTKAGKWLKVSTDGSTYELVNVYLIFEDGSHYLVDKESVNLKET